MNRYWDLSERERADLSEEMVRSFINVELMEKGVMRVDPPVLHRIEPVDLPRSTYYFVKFRTEADGYDRSLDVAFRSVEEAEKFLALKPLHQASDWQTDTASVDIITSAAIEPKAVVERQVVLNAHLTLKANKEKREANTRAESDWKLAQKAVDEASRGVWSDWHECQEKRARMVRLMRTKAEYELMTNGDAALARSFLLKVTTEELLTEASQWFPNGVVDVGTVSSPLPVLPKQQPGDNIPF